jgi:hypothetical protein
MLCVGVGVGPPQWGGGSCVCITSLVGNLDAEDLSTLNEWEKEEGLRSEDAANTAIPPQLYSTIFLPFQKMPAGRSRLGKLPHHGHPAL